LSLLTALVPCCNVKPCAAFVGLLQELRPPPPRRRPAHRLDAVLPRVLASILWSPCSRLPLDTWIGLQQGEPAPPIPCSISAWRTALWSGR
jgi:hypothetical protein